MLTKHSALQAFPAATLAGTSAPGLSVGQDNLKLEFYSTRWERTAGAPSKPSRQTRSAATGWIGLPGDTGVLIGIAAVATLPYCRRAPDSRRLRGAVGPTSASALDPGCAFPFLDHSPTVERQHPSAGCPIRTSSAPRNPVTALSQIILATIYLTNPSN